MASRPRPGSQAGPPTAALREYLAEYRRSFPALAGVARQSKVLSYYDASEALLTAIEHVGGDLSDGRSRLRRELARMQRPAPGWCRSPGSRTGRRCVTSRSCVSSQAHGGKRPSLETVGTMHDVEQTYGGLLSAAPPPSKASQPCRKATPPPWSSLATPARSSTCNASRSLAERSRQGGGRAERARSASRPSRAPFAPDRGPRGATDP